MVQNRELCKPKKRVISISPYKLCLEIKEISTEFSIKDIEEKFIICQRKASKAIHFLENIGILIRVPKPTQGKGRPTQFYTVIKIEKDANSTIKPINFKSQTQQEFDEKKKIEFVNISSIFGASLDKNLNNNMNEIPKEIEFSKSIKILIEKDARLNHEGVRLAIEKISSDGLIEGKYSISEMGIKYS